MRQFVVFMGLLALLCGPAHGESILGNLLTADGIVDSMNDNSRSLIIDAQQSGEEGYDVLSAGDQVVGILQIERVNRTYPSSSGIFAIFAFELTGEYTYGGDTFYQCDAIQSSNANSLKSLLDDALEPSSVDWDNSLFAFVEIDSLGANDPKDPFSAANTGTGIDPLGVITNVLTASNGYSLDMITGLEDSDDFLVLKECAQFASISAIQSDDSAVQIFSERAGMSILYDAFDFDYMSVGLNNTFYGMEDTSHEIILNPDGAIQTSDDTVPNWHLEDDANFRLNPQEQPDVPEPSTIILTLSCLATLGFIRPSRRK